MNSKYVIFAIATLLVLSSTSMAVATTGTYLQGKHISDGGPLVNTVTISVLTTESANELAITSGQSQAVEWTFSYAAYTSIAGSPGVIQGSTPTYESVYIAFNYLKFPGNSVNFRRAILDLISYSYVQATILSGVEGTATADMLPCSLDAGACPNVGTGTAAYYQTSTGNLTAAAAELCEVNGGHSLEAKIGGIMYSGASCITQVATSGYTSIQGWYCQAANGTACASTGAVFAPVLIGRLTLYRNDLAGYLVTQAGSIGLTISNTNVNGEGAVADCYDPNGEEVVTPGAYQNTGYNSAPTTNATLIQADTCDMYTVGSVGSVAFVGFTDAVNSQFAGTTENTGNYYSSTGFHGAADSQCPVATCPSYVETTTSNLDYLSNEILYATSLGAANTAAKSFDTAFALQVPLVYAYYLNALFADSANGWTGFANVTTIGPNELGGAWYTIINAHQCGSSSCTIGSGPGQAPLGGNFNYTLEAVSDVSGLNPAYNTPWVWQFDVEQLVYDTALITPAAEFNKVNDFINYYTVGNTTTLESSFTLGGAGSEGAGWYYFQEPCGTNILTCQAHAFETPGSEQTGHIAPTMYSNGEEVTFTLKSGIYFSDGIQVTAKDWVFSLDFLNVAESPNYPDSASPYSGEMAGPLGLIAAHYSGQTVTFYIGSQSIWSYGDLVVPILPEHIWANYFNADHTSTFAFGAVDVSLPYAFGANAYSTAGKPHPSSSSWVQYLNNLMIGSGAFILNSWSDLAGTGNLTRNDFYFNTNSTALAAFSSVAALGTYTWTGNLTIPIYNPTSSPIVCANGNIAAFATGECQVEHTTGVGWAAVGAGKLKVYNSVGTLVRNLPITANHIAATYSGSVPTGLATLTGHSCPHASATCYTLPAGVYKLVLQTTYAFHGQTRTWYQVYGLTVS